MLGDCSRSTFARFQSLLSVLTVLAALVSPNPTLGADDAPAPAIEERWYVLLLEGSHAGHLRETISRMADRHTIRADMHLAIRRGEDRLNIRMESESSETPDGRMLDMSSVMNLGAAPTTTRYEFGERRVLVTTEINGRANTQRKALPTGKWLSPLKAAEYVESQISAGAKTITVRTLDSAVGLKPFRYTRTLGESTNIDLLGRTVPAIAWTSVVDIEPGVTNTEYVDEAGRSLKTEIRFGAMKFEMILADKDLALSKIDPPELMAATLIKPDRPIRDPRTVAYAKYILSPVAAREPGRTPPALFDLPTTGSQTVERLDDGRLRVTVIENPKLTTDSGNCDEPAFSAPSAMIECDHPTIASLLTKALPSSAQPHAHGQHPPAERAEKLRRFVHKHIKTKSLGVGFASAAQVAQTREGDCSEHAVLLCALLRADHIPARVVSGLVYVDEFLGQSGVFGYHMWTQAGIAQPDGSCRWIDLDATLDRDDPFDATHIALDTTALAEDNTINSMARLAPMIGAFTIEIERTEKTAP